MSASSLNDGLTQRLNSGQDVNRKAGCSKKRVTVSEITTTIEPQVSGLDVYSSLHRNMRCQTLNSHFVLQDAPTNYHYKLHGLPTTTWYSCVNKLLLQRTQLTILRKLYHQQYYTKQFLFKLQQFLLLQHSVRSQVSFYQSLSLSGEGSKLPKLSLLCKQVLALLHDLDSCSVHKLCKTFNIDKKVRYQLSGLFLQCEKMFGRMLFDLVQAIRTLRHIILFEIRFCYLFSNYRSRLYSFIDVVIKCNDMVFHPAVLGAVSDIAVLVVSLEDIININVAVASAYIARSLHYKTLSAALKSVPVVAERAETPSACSQCQVCNKYSLFLHKYTQHKAGQFIDAVSLMLQGAGDNRILARTELCTSRCVEHSLTAHLLAQLYYQANSSVFYENRLTSGEARTVTIHEKFNDNTKKNKHRWEENYTSVVYSATHRGLPNAWTCLYDLQHMQYTFYKLDNHATDYYSAIAASHGKQLKRGYVSTLLYRGLQDILALLRTDSVDMPKYGSQVTDAVTALLNQLSYYVLSDHWTTEQVELLILYTTHLQYITQLLHTVFYRLLLKHVSTAEHKAVFGIMTCTHQLYTLLSTLHSQLQLPEDVWSGSDTTAAKVPAVTLNLYKAKLRTSSHCANLLQDLLCKSLELLKPGLHSALKETIVNELPPTSYWKKANHGTETSNYMCAVLEGVIKPVSGGSGCLAEPYLTRLHHLLLNATARLLLLHLLSCKKIHFSESGAGRLESDVQQLVEYFQSDLCPLPDAQVLLSTPDVLNLRKEVKLLTNKKGRVKCSCQKHGNWKRLSAPNLCSNCNNTPARPSPTDTASNHNSLKVRGDVFSDSEVDMHADASEYLKHKQANKLTTRLNSSAS